MSEHCCDTMKGQLEAKCPSGADPSPECADLLVWRDDKGAWFAQAPNATHGISYCPWCGARLADGAIGLADVELAPGAAWTTSGAGFEIPRVQGVIHNAGAARVRVRVDLIRRNAEEGV